MPLWDLCREKGFSPNLLLFSCCHNLFCLSWFCSLVFLLLWSLPSLSFSFSLFLFFSLFFFFPEKEMSVGVDAVTSQLNNGIQTLNGSYRNGTLARRRRRRGLLSNTSLGRDGGAYYGGRPRNNFPMYRQPREELVPVYAVVPTEEGPSSYPEFPMFAWQPPSSDGYAIMNVGTVTVGHLQGLAGVGTGALVATTGVVAGGTIATAGAGVAALTCTAGMGAAALGNEVGGLCVQASAGAVLCMFAAFPGTASAMSVIGVAVMGAGAGCMLALGSGALGDELIYLSGRMMRASLDTGANVARSSCSTGLAMTGTGLRSLVHSTCYGLNSAALASIRAILSTTQLLVKNKKQSATPAMIECEVSLTDVDGEEFVVIDQKPSLTASEFLEDCVGIEREEGEEEAEEEGKGKEPEGESSTTSSYMENYEPSAPPLETITLSQLANNPKTFTVITTNWYYRRLERSFVFYPDRFERVDPTTGEVRASHFYASVEKVIRKEGGYVVIEFLVAAAEYFEAGDRDMEMMLGLILQGNDGVIVEG